MVNPIRIESPEAVYPITGRGIERNSIVRDRFDRAAFLKILIQSK